MSISSCALWYKKRSVGEWQGPNGVNVECWLPMRPRASSLNLMLSLSSPSSPGVMALYNVNDTFAKASVIYYRGQQPPLLQHQAVALQCGK